MRTLFKRLAASLRDSETVGPVILAIAIGLASGAGAIVLRHLIRYSRVLFFDGGGRVLGGLTDAYVIVLPACGIILASILVRWVAHEAGGSGVPQVMYAVRKEGGRIRSRVAFVKAAAVALTIGAGGSVGREGPIVQIGSSLASSLGRLVGFRESRTKVMVACGAAGAIGATFNAPIAGVIFSLEVILGNFAARSFGLVVISSVTATALSHSVLGKAPAFHLMQPFDLRSPAELPLYLLLGLFLGLLSFLFVRTVDQVQGLFARWSWHWTVKALLGGVFVGSLGYFGSPLLFDTGNEGVELALALGTEHEIVRMGLRALLVLVLLKILATSVTLGAGGSGGIFAPSLFIGAMAGAAIGLLFEALFPSITAPAGAYALVGMAAFYSGTAHAPITSILILFEMTDRYQIILPLMLAAVGSYLLSSRLSSDSIYTLVLRRRGGLSPDRSHVSILDVMIVADAMTTEVEAVSPDDELSSIVARFREEHIRSFPVLDRDQRLVGIVTETDLDKALRRGSLEGVRVGEVMSRNLVTCTPEQTLRDVLRRSTTQEVAQLPVVDRRDPTRMVGVLLRSEILWAYGEMAAEHEQMLDQSGFEIPIEKEDSVQIEVEVAIQHTSLAFRKLKEVRMPDQCLIVMLRRADRAIVPRGETVIEPGDILVTLTTKSNEAKLRAWVAALGGLS